MRKSKKRSYTTETIEPPKKSRPLKYVNIFLGFITFGCLAGTVYFAINIPKDYPAEREITALTAKVETAKTALEKAETADARAEKDQQELTAENQQLEKDLTAAKKWHTELESYESLHQETLEAIKKAEDALKSDNAATQTEAMQETAKITQQFSSHEVNQGKIKQQAEEDA